MKPEVMDALREQLIVEPVDLIKGATTWWRIFSFNEETGEIRKMVSQKNIIPYQGADVLARILGGDHTWAPGAMLFEFENTAGSPTIPIPTRDEGIDYYLGLSGTKDYLRIPLIVPPSFSASSGNYGGNQVTFWAVTSGTEGQAHSLQFGDTQDSKVYGVGLAATPTPDQYTQDRVFSRSYTGFSPVPKEAGYQIGAQYLIRFN